MRRIEGRSAWSIFWPLKRPKGIAHSILLVILLALAANCAIAQPVLGASADGKDPAEIVWMMVAHNETRAQKLKYFTALRHYHLDFHGLGRTMTADMHAQVTYIAGTGKSFHIVDESGSGLLLNHVLKPLLETEQADSREQKASLTPFNYRFNFDSMADEGGRRLYVFSVEPKVRNKLLYRGKIWIDASDYAVVRVEAQPAESPSFWVKSTAISHTYEKSGDFWLPRSNRSESKVRFGGTAVLTIDYGIYQFGEPHELTLNANELASQKSLQAAQ